MAVQDDRRENEMRELFELTKRGGRGDIDAELTLDGLTIPFELKSTTNDSFSTVRDLGPDHIKKWRALHWIFGVYDESGRKLRHCYYASPTMMRPWIDVMSKYIEVDCKLATVVPNLIGPNERDVLLGAKKKYTLTDAVTLQKKQHTVAEYRAMMDLPDGYSPDRMLQILRSRCKYIIERGSTLNNPHIKGSYFAGWDRITDDHAARLRRMVRKALVEDGKKRR